MNFILIFIINIIFSIATTQYLNSTEGWCCRQKIPKILEVKYKIKHCYMQKAKHMKSGTERCGFLWIYHCTLYETKYYRELITINESFEISRDGICPTESLVCCEDRIEIEGHCLSMTDKVSNNLETLSVLKKEGLFGR
ncbi:hypothetical protein SNEBB_009946 [Seison nebaliae]|nr:hypothetical protein SNEBB_009946 [Seison nebaliae]